MIWINFQDRLPTQADANEAGMVLVRFHSFERREKGDQRPARFDTSRFTEREGMWDWISPTHPQARELWAANGIFAWSPLSKGKP